MVSWKVERIAHFDFERDLCIDGLVHFGFHDRSGRQFILAHQKHFLGLLGEKGTLKWTVANKQVLEEVPNISADIQFPIYVDSLPDGTLVVSNFGNNKLFRVDPDRMESSLLFDGSLRGMKNAGNCVVDGEGNIWLNEVEGCKVWRLDSTGKPTLELGTGEPGFQADAVDFEKARFNWIYDIRKGPDGDIYVLDSRNFAVRRIDISAGQVFTLAGTGKPGYEGDGGDPRHATFGGDPTARFDGPISMSLDEEGNIFVGDRFNKVVRMIERKADRIHTIAGDASSTSEAPNESKTSNPLALRLPMISSMDYFRGRLFVPTDLPGNTGDLAVLTRV